MKSLRIAAMTAITVSVLLVALDGCWAIVDKPWWNSVTLLWIGACTGGVIVVASVGLLLYADLDERLERQPAVLAELVAAQVAEICEAMLAEARSDGYGEGFLAGSRNNTKVTSLNSRKP